MLYRIEQKWMCQSHGILQLPRSLFRTVVLPLHLYLPYGLTPEHTDLLVEDTHWLDSKLSHGFHLNHIPIYHMVRIMYIFLKQRNMKNIIIIIFQVFIVFSVARSIKSMQCGYSLDAESNSVSNELSQSKFE